MSLPFLDRFCHSTLMLRSSQLSGCVLRVCIHQPTRYLDVFRRALAAWRGTSVWLLTICGAHMLFRNHSRSSTGLSRYPVVTQPLPSRMCSACVHPLTDKMPRCISPSFWSMAWCVSVVIDNLWCAHAVQFTPLLLYRFTVHPDTTHLPAVRMCSACVHPPTDKRPGFIAPSFYSMAWCRSVVIDNLWCAHAVQITPLLLYWLTLHL